VGTISLASIVEKLWRKCWCVGFLSSLA